MRLAINGRPFTQTTTGVQRYAREVVSILDDMVATGDSAVNGMEIEVLIPKGVGSPPKFQAIAIREVGSMGGHLWEQLELPIHSRGSWLLSLANAGPLAKARQLVVIHDAAVFAMPENYSVAFRRWYQFLLPALGRNAECVVTVSKFSKQELLRYCGIPSQKMHVVYEGYEHILRPVLDTTILEHHGLAGRPFILGVSSQSPSKNFSALVRALDHLANSTFTVAIAGGVTPGVFRQTQAGRDDAVRYLGYVTDGQLRALLEHATCFVHPALYEGFGLTPLEAIACGCPVVVADIPSLREVCGDAAIFVNPRDPVDIAAKIDLVLSDPALRATLVDNGKRRLQKFGWEACVRGLLGALKEVAHVE